MQIEYYGPVGDGVDVTVDGRTFVFEPGQPTDVPRKQALKLLKEPVFRAAGPVDLTPIDPPADPPADNDDAEDGADEPTTGDPE